MTTQNKKTKFINLGLRDYKDTWDYQEALFKVQVDRKIENRKLPKEAQVPTENILIFCQHPHVYTLGKSGKPENLLLDESGLREKHASYYKINRGGDITYHGPGQIVGYPIIDLDNFFTDIHRYLRLLEEAVILTLKDYQIDAGRINGLTGVWIDYKDEEQARKICALGVKCSRWVTMHGFAFNVTADLDYFQNIIPCGIEDKAVTSLDKELGYTPVIQEVEERLKGHIASLFEMEIVQP
ncbi:MAG: lipoyl(octanoyl) transferase LipB [Marinoscillum sp.]